MLRLRTPHNALMVAIAPVGYRTVWYEWDFGTREFLCALCQRPIFSQGNKTKEEIFQRLIEHEELHVEALGRAKVEAAEALATMLANGMEHASIDWQELLKEVWGALPPAAIPYLTNDRTTKDHDHE